MARRLTLPCGAGLRFSAAATPFYEGLAHLFISPGRRAPAAKTMFTLDWKPHAAPPPRPEKAEAIRFHRGRPWRGALAQERLWLRAGSTTLLADGKRLNLTLYGRPGRALPPPLLYKSFLAIGLAFLLQRLGRYYLHGAALCRGRRTLLLLGDGRSGKSTTSYALARKGFRLLSDDALLLRRHRNGRVSLAPFYFDLSLPGDMLPRFPEVLPALSPRPQKPREKKFSLLAERGRLFHTAPGAVPKELIFLTEHPGAPPSAAAALAELLRQNPFALARPGAPAHPHLAALSALVRQCRRHRFAPRRQPLAALLSPRGRRKSLEKKRAPAVR